MNASDSIRPMPRARQEINAIIERLNALRSDIDSMNAVVDQVNAPPLLPCAKNSHTIQNSQDGSAQSTIKEEEKRIQHLQTRIKQLKARVCCVVIYSVLI
jgi:peptidoglycan hydrolase CwlO-like protein